nr:uncharacterized protein LOC104095602 [Nicotiana tomentosiformis]
MANLHRKSVSPPSSNPLFSTIITLYTLILLYFPTNYQTILFSPVFLSTSLLLLSLLRLGQTQKTNKEDNYQGKEKKPNSEEFISTQKSSSLVSRVDPNPNPVPLLVSGDHDYTCVSHESSVHLKTEQDPDLGTNPNFNPKPDTFYAESFVEWNVRAPLEVIQEEYEDEKFYYTDTDMDTGANTSSGGESPVIGNWDSPGNLCFRWEEEDREGLIEIELDGKRSCEAEEENLIEIDLTPSNFPGR